MKIEHLLGETPLRDPGRVALDDGARVLTYRELAGVVTAEAQFLRAAGSLRCATLADNGCGWVVADLALHHLHRVHVPLPHYFTPAQQRHVLESAGVDTVLTDDAAFTQRVHGQFELLYRSPHSGLHLFRRAVAEHARRPLAPDTTKITFTSGSTAAPRGVCLGAAALDRTSRALVDATAALAIRRHLSVLPLSVLLENVAGVHAALRSGATCVVPPTRQTGMSFESLRAGELLAAISGAAPHSLILVPELLRLMVGATLRGHWRPPQSLKFVAVGGAVIARGLLDAAERLGIPAYEGYGLSECASVVCLNTPQARRAGSVGRPLPHVRVSVDAHGEIHVEGTAMERYLDEPRGTPPPRSIATGDLGRFDPDGYLYLEGRRRNLIITSLGRNVAPEWVESELVNEPAIARAVVAGEGRPAISAWLHPSGPQVDAAALAAAVASANSRLPPYARVRHWRVMPQAPDVESGLLTGNGRLRRDAVLARFGSPEPDDADAVVAEHA